MSKIKRQFCAQSPLSEKNFAAICKSLANSIEKFCDLVYNERMETSYYISKAIKKFLTERGISAFTLSKESGCNKTAVNSWLYQRQLPSAKGLIKLCDYMNVSADYVLGLTNDSRIIRSGTNESFYSRVKMLLASSEVTAYRLAKECHLGSSAISKWADTSRFPKVEVLIKLSALFSVPVDWLLGRTNIL